jgi:hypothetical protein
VDDRCLQGFGELYQLVMRALATAAAEQRDAPSLVEEIGQLVERLVRGHDNRLRGQKSHRQRRGRVRNRLERDVAGNDDDADTALIDRAAHGDLDRARHLLGDRNKFAITGAFPEKLLGMGFLEVARADFGRGNVSRDSLIAGSGAEHTLGWRLPAHDVEEAVIRIITAALNNPGPLIERLGLSHASAEQIQLALDRAARLSKTLSQGSPGERTKLTVDLIERVVIEGSAVSIALWKRPLVVTGGAPEASPHETILLSAPVAFRRRGVETKLVLAAAVEVQRPGRVDNALVKAVARGRLWFEQLAAGEMTSLEAIADRERVSARYVSRLLPLAFLAPDIVDQILQGRHPADLSAARLTNRLALPLDWAHQRELIGA